MSVFPIVSLLSSLLLFPFLPSLQPLSRFFPLRIKQSSGTFTYITANGAGGMESPPSGVMTADSSFVRHARSLPVLIRSGIKVIRLEV